MKNPKDAKTWTTEVAERIQKGVDTREAVPLSKMEELYLSQIKKYPEKYEEYLAMSDAEKYEALKKASQDILDRAQITKEMEEETRDYYKN